MNVADYVGVFGAFTYLCAYAGLQMGKLSGVGYTYPLLYMTAASCVLFSLTSHFNMSAAIIQPSFIAISLFGIARLTYLRRSIKFNEDEAAFLASKLPSLRKQHASKLLRLGHWVSGEPGTVLTRENEVVSDLIYLQSGEASVKLGDHVIGYCGADTFVGEMTSMHGEPATATVELVSPARYLRIGAKAMRDLAKREPEIFIALNSSFSTDMRAKLLVANRRQIVAEHVSGVSAIDSLTAIEAAQAEKSSPSSL